ncbi:hypothetical protein [Vibrio splendidus]|uniref:hypothetical protein n=1 Tax=Vibrio splendidus TaxID=29497 RepID=UPI003D14CBFF
MSLKLNGNQALDSEKIKIVEQFISGCQQLGLSMEDSVELAAKNLIGAVAATGNSHAKIEVNNVGTVEVDC